MVPDPGTGSMPPGFEVFTTILGWGKWIALGILVISLIFAGVRMGIASSRHGDGSEHINSIGSVLLGVIIASAAFALVSFIAA